MQFADFPILYLEDHADTRMVMSKVLRSWGFAICVAETVADARAVFRSEAIAMILADVGLPDGNGCEFFIEAQMIRPVRGLALTAYGALKDIEECRQAGFHRHLLKPVQLEMLLDALLEIVVAVRKDRKADRATNFPS